MAEPQPAIDATLEWEGKYSNHPADPGGETYRGISRRHHSYWPGWKLVDAHRSSPDFPRCLDADNDLQQMVDEFYLVYWHSGPYDQLHDQGIANKLYDLAFNVGPSQDTKLVQNACNSLGYQLAVDGDFGSKTIAAINAIYPGDLLPEIRGQAVAFYLDLARRRPESQVFLDGWLRRAKS